MFHKIKNFFRETRHWFHMHMRRSFFKLLSTMLKGYPYDSTYLYEVEKAKIEEMIEHFERVIEKYDGYDDIKGDVKCMKLCVKLIDIILNEGDLYDYDGNITFEPSSDHEGYYELKKSKDWKYICKVNVNLKNMARFVEPQYFEFYRNSPHELYLIKAKHLYHKIRAERDEGWWE